MTMRAGTRHCGRAHLGRLVESIPEIKNSILASGGGVVTAWPLKPVIRIVGLAATNPEMLDLLGYVPESIETDIVDASVVRMRRGQLLTAPVNDEFSLKIFFPLRSEIDDAHLRHIRKAVDEIRASLNLA